MERYRLHSDGAVFFVTFAVVEWLPVFVSERACKIVTTRWGDCTSYGSSVVIDRRGNSNRGLSCPSP